jgi:hypothetical protein
LVVFWWNAKGLTASIFVSRTSVSNLKFQFPSVLCE